MTKSELKESIIESLTSQGFSVNGHIMPKSLTKAHFKKIQTQSKREQVKLQHSFLVNATPMVKKFIRHGVEIKPENIDLELREVQESSLESILFRWWNLIWWSVPYQKAYGRQMRFILWDKAHEAPFGLIGLQSPILKIAARDEYLKIPKTELDYVINQSMQAQRLGALPPYNELLGGKMTALAISANEIRQAYENKYTNVQTIINERIIEPELIFITTTSAFGRSSIYNRLKYKDELVAKSLGYTKGSGTFHINEDLYYEIQKFLQRRKINTNTTFGYGASRKVKLLDQAFSLLDLNTYHYHNLQREFFIFPLANNLQDVISKHAQPSYYDRPLTDLIKFWKERWALPRSTRNEFWKEFNADKFITNAKRNMTTWSK